MTRYTASRKNVKKCLERDKSLRTPQKYEAMYPEGKPEVLEGT